MIAAEALGFSYPGGAPVITEFTRQFLPRTITVITGASGSGKSTLLYLLGLMLTPRSGGITWDGRNVAQLSDAERSAIRAREIGFVFQDAMLDPSRSIFDNVIEGSLYAGLPFGDAARRTHFLLQHFGVSERVDRRPGEISGGQAQRVALCRALVKSPALLLADEPSGNLDEENADLVWRALEDAAADGTAVIVATHDPRRATDTALRIEI